MIFLAALAAVSALAFAPKGTTSSAGSVPEISLELDRCDMLPRDEVLRLTALELDAHVLAPPQSSPGVTRAGIVCGGSTIHLFVADPLTGKQLSRTIRVSPAAENVLARTVALAVSELVITSWMELTLPNAPVVTADSQATAGLRQAALERAERVTPPPATNSGYVLLLGQAVGPFAGVGFGWGGGVRLGWASGTPLLENRRLALSPGVDLELTGARSDARTSLGQVRTAIWSAEVRGSVKLRRGRAWMELGAGGRFGLARLVGMPADPQNARGGTLAGTWAGPTSYLGVGFQWARFVTAAGVEGGYVLRSVSGQTSDGDEVSVSGAWLSVMLAMGWGQ